MNDTTRSDFVEVAERAPETRAVTEPRSVVEALLAWPAFLRSLLVLVGLPTLVAGAYYGVLASDIYVSETRYAIRTSDQAPAGDLITAVLKPTGGSGSSEDAKIVRDYILSRDMLSQLQAKLDLRAHYGSAGVDWFARLPGDASEEDFLEYYREMVEANTEPGSDITVLRVRAFDAQTAQRIAQSLIDLSEVLVNRMSERIIEDTLRFARHELEIAEDQVRQRSAAVTRFRNESRSIDPGEETSAVLSIVTALESQLAASRAELIEAETYMRGDTVQVKQLTGRVRALEKQVENERKRLAGESGTELTRLIGGYEPLILDQKLAEQRYSSALTSLEVARAEAQRKQRYLIPFVTPELPDEALEPERAWNILTVFVGAMLVYAIGALVWAAINDQIGV